MESIREHLMYKNSPLQICFEHLTSQEQYEVIRILLESKTDVTICAHKNTNKFVDLVCAKLNVKSIDCSTVEVKRRLFS